jgi:hypothetical protein
MTTTEDAASFAPSVRRQPVALCLLVGAAVTVGWVLYRHYWTDDVHERIRRWDWFAGRFWAVTLVLALVLCVPYALALLVWGRGLMRGVSGALIALAAGLYVWGQDRVFQDFVWDERSPTQTSLRLYVWTYLLVVAVLVPLAWGVARRSGRGWLLGLLVGPVVAAILRELQLRWSWWHDHVVPTGPGYHWQFEAVAFMAPFVLAALACWALEARAADQALPDSSSDSSSDSSAAASSAGA